MSAREADYEHWARVAAQWIAWARTPGHDVFWAYRESLVAFIGRGSGDALDVGCGEGRVSRELRACGYHVTAVDPVRELLDAARDVDSAHAYAVASASGLPFDDASFDLIVAYNVLMDVEDVSAAMKEMRRVMRPGGQVLISVVHPFADHGRFEDFAPDAQFIVSKPYFGRQRFDDTERRNGLSMRFAGWSVTLEHYMQALESAGFAITSLREPVPDSRARQPHMQRWSRMPLFLWIKAQARAAY